MFLQERSSHSAQVLARSEGRIWRPQNGEVFLPEHPDCFGKTKPNLATDLPRLAFAKTLVESTPLN
jgi:hypothetical protein